jgi:Ca2+-transporting ATPase
MHETGLSFRQAEELLQSYGPNELPENPPPGNLRLIIEQLSSPLVYILIAAAVVTIFLHDYTDAIVIGIAVFLNTILGFIQEKRAGEALQALKGMIHPEAKVIREGQMQTIDVAKLVPGDLVVLNQGDKVPADGSLIFANRLFLSEALLTGESVPVTKQKDDEVFMGTVVTAGRGKFIVEKTGAKTEIGKIATSIDEIGEDTPLRRQLVTFSRQLSLLVISLTALIFVIGLVVGRTPEEIFKTSVALAVSAIPEGLLVGLTVVLAIGMQRILAKKGLVRNLVSAETLGGVTFICVDKTGTLTEGKMQVVDVIGDFEKLKLQTVVANDLDDPIVVAAYEWGTQTDHIKAENYERLDSIPFSSDNKVFLSLNRYDDKNNIILVNGAPEVLIEKAKMKQGEKEWLYGQIENLSGQGKRVLGFARKLVDTEKATLSLEDIEGDLTWEGLIAFSDPVRKDVQDAFEKTKNAGIRLVVITGDYSKTAVSVLNQIGIEITDQDIILGTELENLPDEELRERLFNNENVKLFARTKPEQKMKIVQVLKDHNEVVAMMGDGVNDAPAITAADIGIVVGEATDVAKESADLVLLDSSFKTIVLAIEEGRGIFDNLRKMILYLMSDAFVEIILVMGILILEAFIDGLPLPITAAQILYVNLVSDGFPNLALTIDPKAKGIMNNKPRSPEEFLVTRWMKLLIFIVSFIGGVMAMIIFYFVYQAHGEVFARSVTFATVGTNSLVYVFSIKALHEPFWKVDIFNNKWLLAAVAGGFLLQIAPFVVPVLRTLFEIQPIGLYWLVVFGAAIVLFIVIELTKWFFTPHLKRFAGEN